MVDHLTSTLERIISSRRTPMELMRELYKGEHILINEEYRYGDQFFCDHLEDIMSLGINTLVLVSKTNKESRELMRRYMCDGDPDTYTELGSRWKHGIARLQELLKLFADAHNHGMAVYTTKEYPSKITHLIYYKDP